MLFVKVYSKVVYIECYLYGFYYVNIVPVKLIICLVQTASYGSNFAISMRFKKKDPEV